MKEKIEYILIDANIRKNILLSKIKERIINDEEGADIIEIIIASAFFAAAAVFVFGVVSEAFKSKSENAADIINNASFK